MKYITLKNTIFSILIVQAFFATQARSFYFANSFSDLENRISETKKSLSETCPGTGKDGCMGFTNKKNIIKLSCRHKFCKQCLGYVEKNIAQEVTCPKCSTQYCYKCSLSHNPEKISCTEHENKLSKAWKENYTKNCPKCARTIIKEDEYFYSPGCQTPFSLSCNEITCPCGHKFCWECLQEFRMDPPFQNHQNNYACNKSEDTRKKIQEARRQRILTDCRIRFLNDSEPDGDQEDKEKEDNRIDHSMLDNDLD